MPILKYVYRETMSQEEIDFLKEKRRKDWSLHLRTVRIITVIFGVVPCLLGIFMEGLARKLSTPDELLQRQEQEPHVYLFYMFGMVALVIIIIIAIYFSYWRTIRPLDKDIRTRLKMVECTEIVQKQFISSNQSYHFRLRSRTRLSIEVSQEVYQQYEEGDEINIEYSNLSRVYFGFF